MRITCFDINHRVDSALHLCAPDSGNGEQVEDLVVTLYLLQNRSVQFNCTRVLGRRSESASRPTELYRQTKVDRSHPVVETL